jgi:hypothetical protein
MYNIALGTNTDLTARTSFYKKLEIKFLVLL